MKHFEGKNTLKRLENDHSRIAKDMPQWKMHCGYKKNNYNKMADKNSSKSLNVMTERTKSWLRDDPFSIFKGKNTM